MGPLAGLKVLELGQLIAGPFAAKTLAEFGAEVIKIEPPADGKGGGGDPIRTWRKLHNGTSLWWYLQARNKKSVTINLRDPAGQEVVRRIARDVDIVIENFRPGTMEKWGLGYEQLALDNPGLIMLRISGFGQTGPLRDQAGFGSIGESMGGLRYVTGFPDRPPVRMNVSLGDAIASLHGVIGTLMALHHKSKTGQGQIVDVALTEAVFNLMEGALPEYDKSGEVRERVGTSLTGIVPSNTYTSKEGTYIVIGANGDSIFKRLMTVIGRDDLGNDPTLADNAGRVKRVAELDEAIGAWCAAHDAPTILRALDAAQVPNSRIYSIADIAKDAQYLARGMIEQHHLPDGEPIKLPGVVPKLSRTPGSTQWVGPELGAHTDETLRAKGFSAAEIEKMRAAGVV